jgi:hypothetical protein
VLASAWNGDEEVVWAQHEVLRALGEFADVQLISLGGPEKVGRSDYPIAVHDIGIALTGRETLRRDLLIAGFSQHSDGRDYERPAGWPAESVDAILRHGTGRPWSDASSLVEAFEPDAVVILDHRDRDVLLALRTSPNVPVVLVPLVDTVATPGRVHYDELFERAERIVVLSEPERRSVAGRSAQPTSLVELPVDVSTVESSSTPPEPYVLVFTDSGVSDRFGRRAYAEFVVQANPETPIVVVSRGGSMRWQAGTGTSLAFPTSPAELGALIAGASVVVDLHPGRLMARRCIASLRLGTPILVPERSRAKVLCEEGRGGLWFCDAGQLLWAVDALYGSDVGSRLGLQGRRYCDEHHGSPERTAAQLREAFGSVLPPPPPQAEAHQHQ